MEAQQQIAKNPDEETARVQKVRTLHDHKVLLHSPLWENPGVLQDLIKDDKAALAIDLSKQSLETLRRAHGERKFPSSLFEMYHLVMKAAELKLGSLEQLCLKHLFRNPRFWRINYPAQFPDAGIITCFEASLSRLFRTKAVYQHELFEILKLNRGTALRESLFQTLKMKVKEFRDLGLECVPIRFYRRSVPIVIMRLQGGPQSAICFEGDCLPFELFGRNFDLYEANVEAFYLKYATYTVYKSGTSVYFKDLRNRKEARKVLENCTFFMSKEDDVFAVSEESSGSLIWKWIDDVGNAGSFAALHRTSEVISKIDFDPETGALLILEKSGSLSVRRNRDLQLPLMWSFRGSFHSAWFHNGRLFTLDSQGEAGNGPNVHRQNLRSKSLTDGNSYPEIDAISGEDEAEKSERATDVELERECNDGLANFASGRRIMSLGGKLLRISPNGLEMYDYSTTRFLLGHGQYVASSELYLFP